MYPNVSYGCAGYPAYPPQGSPVCGVSWHACCPPWVDLQAVAWPWWGWCGAAPVQVAETPCLSVPKELEASADAPSVEAVVGGSVAARIFVEYMKGDGEEPPPMVSVTVSTGDESSTWKDSSIGEGYHVKSDLPVVSPGSKILVEATNALARAKWLEVTGTSTPA